MAALDVLIDYPGAEYKLTKAFSSEHFVCRLTSEAHRHNPGDGLGARDRADVRFEWFELDSNQIAGCGWLIVDAAHPKTISFQGLYIDDGFQGRGIFTSIVGAIDVWTELGFKECKVRGTLSSAPMFKRYGFENTDDAPLAGGTPLAIYSKQTSNSQNELEPSSS